MKKIGIVTSIGLNYGNRLQNYALQEYLKKINVESVTIKNVGLLNKKSNVFNYFLRNVKFLLKKHRGVNKREKNFAKFNKNISFSKKNFNWLNTKWLDNFDFFISGSDQVWNPYFRLSDFDLLTFAPNEKKISYAASFGVSEIPKEKRDSIKEINKYLKISVRENEGKNIIENLTKRKDVEVLIDPTMLLSAEDWDKVSHKPPQLKSTRYILNYFLGELPEIRKNEIERIAKDNNCEIINLLDSHSTFYDCGPSEFLYLEKNAFLICTDSFHSSVFAILYDKPFIIFERENKDWVSMNSRIETLILKFQLEDRKFNGKNITSENLKHDYTRAFKILEDERKKSYDFLRDALNLKDSD